MTRVVSVNL